MRVRLSGDSGDEKLLASTLLVGRSDRTRIQQLIYITFLKLGFHVNLAVRHHEVSRFISYLCRPVDEGERGAAY